MGDAAQSGRDGLWPFPGHDGGGAVRLMMPVVVEEIELLVTMVNPHRDQTRPDAGMPS